jgi:hypothetical protein
MAEGTRFKTGFLPAPISYTGIGAQIGDRISQGIQGMSDEFERRKAQTNQTMGFTDALGEAVPAGITSKYREGAQILLTKYQNAATKAYRTGVQSDIDEYQRLRGEFIEFKNISTAKSALDNQTRLSIAQGQYKNLSGGIAESLDKYNEYSKANYSWNEATRQLEVVMGNGQTNWRESNIADMNDVFVPSTLWKGTEYMTENLGNSVYEDVLKAREATYQNLTDLGFADGTLNNEAIYEDIDTNLQSKFAVRGTEMMEAIAITGYKNLQKPGAIELTEEDFAEAGVLYNEQEIFAELPSGKNIGDGKLNSSGEWVFDVSDEEVKEEMGNMGSVSRQYIERRKAVKLYMEEASSKAFNLVQVNNQLAQDLSARRSEAAAAARLKASQGDDKPATDLIPVADSVTIPAHLSEEGETVPEKPNQSVYRVPASVKGREFKFAVRAGDEEAAQTTLVNNVVFSPQGELIGYDIATGPGLIEGVTQDIEGLDLSTETVYAFDPRFELINSKFRSVGQAKGRRIGREILEEAATKVILQEFLSQQEKGQE